MRIRTLIAMVGAVALLAAACGDDDDDTADTSGTTAATTADSGSTGTTAAAGTDTGTVDGTGVRVGMALGGPPDDGGYFQSFASGLDAAEEQLGVTTSIQGNLTDEQARIDGVRNLAAENDIVIAAGAEMSDAMLSAAADFPDVKFLSITGQMDPALTNLTAFYVRQGTPNVVGAEVLLAVSGATTIGVIGGLDIPPTDQVLAGVETAAAGADPPAEVVSTVINGFEDTAGANAAATAQIDEGATAIVAFVNTGIEGVISAIEDSGRTDVYVVDQVVPGCDRSPQIVGTAILDASVQVVDMISLAISGDLPTEAVSYGIEDPSIQAFVLCPAFDTPENQAIVEEVTAAINDGTYGLPEGV